MGLNEALLCVQELNSLGFYPDVVQTMLSLALDQRDHKCALVLKLLVYLDAKALKSRFERGCVAGWRAAGGYCHGCP